LLMFKSGIGERSRRISSAQTRLRFRKRRHVAALQSLLSGFDRLCVHF